VGVWRSRGCEVCEEEDVVGAGLIARVRDGGGIGVCLRAEVRVEFGKRACDGGEVMEVVVRGD
jgi:hypothetical protein